MFRRLWSNSAQSDSQLRQRRTGSSQPIPAYILETSDVTVDDMDSQNNMAEPPAGQSMSSNFYRENVAESDERPYLVPPCNSCNLHEELYQAFDYCRQLFDFLKKYREHYDVLWEQHSQYAEVNSKKRPANIQREKSIRFPLISGAARKRDVIDYCKSQAETFRLTNDSTDKESAELLWQFLAMLVEQNGTCIRSDIVELLTLPTEECSTRGNQFDPVAGARQTLPKMPNKADASNEPSKADACSEKTLLHLLLESSAAEALQYAQRNEMWGHAFLLAQTAGEHERAHLASQFIKAAIPEGDPMKTIYELMLTKQTTAVTNIAEDKSTDWRQHLAAIMSQACDEDVSRAAALNLGDALASKGKAVAALICYLAAGIEQELHDDGATKLTRAFENSSLPENAAEVYKYAMSLYKKAVAEFNVVSR